MGVKRGVDRGEIVEIGALKIGVLDVKVGRKEHGDLRRDLQV